LSRDNNSGASGIGFVSQRAACNCRSCISTRHTPASMLASYRPSTAKVRWPESAQTLIRKPGPASARDHLQGRFVARAAGVDDRHLVAPRRHHEGLSLRETPSARERTPDGATRGAVTRTREHLPRGAGRVRDDCRPMWTYHDGSRRLVRRARISASSSRRDRTAQRRVANRATSSAVMLRPTVSVSARTCYEHKRCRVSDRDRPRGRRSREPEATRVCFRRSPFPHRADAYCSLKLIVTVMTTGTGAPFRSVGVYSHCRTASSAA